MVTRLNGLATPFGPLDMTVQASKDGRTATVEVKPLAANCRDIVIHLPDGGIRHIPARQGDTVTFPLQEAHAQNGTRVRKLQVETTPTTT